VDEQWVGTLIKAGFARWEHPCYLWTNNGYSTFADFTHGLSKNMRRNIRREEESILRQGVRIRVLEGDSIDPDWHELMYRFYVGTNQKFGYWAALYLTKDFFRGLFNEFRHRLVIVAAYKEREPTPLAMALFLTKGGKLWGRYWGSLEYVPELHFNVCYYTPLRWAISKGITAFDPGIGTEHKARRGFTACPGISLHVFSDPRFNLLFRTNIGRLNMHTRKTIQKLNNRENPDGE
jgi:predicted N-acyltransferase